VSDIELLETRLGHIVQGLQPMRPAKIVLFGSAARGSADKLSDIDILVVAENVAPRFLDRIADAYDLISHDYALDILIYLPHEYEEMKRDGNPFVEATEREGRVLYERPAA